MRLMGCAAVLASLIGCNAEPGAAPDAAVDAPMAPLVIPMDIVVGTHGFSLYMSGRDKVGCDCIPAKFPDVGEQGGEGDAIPCSVSEYCPAGSCITDLGVEVDGMRLPARDVSMLPVDPLYLSVDPFPTGATTLVIAGCGHPETRIPIARPELPTVTATADYVGGYPHVSWTSSLPATSAIVNISFPTGVTATHLPATATEYTLSQPWRPFFARVTAFVSRVEIVTAFGAATVWHGGGSTLTEFPR